MECKTGFSKVECFVCENDFCKRNIDIKKYPNHCCSMECRAKKNTKAKKMICSVCGHDFSRPPSLIEGKKNAFCSKICADKYQTTKKEIICETCRVPFMQNLCIINRAKHRMNFCSHQCSSKHVFKKSYPEFEMEKMVIKLGIKYSRNDRSVISPLELDFWFPDIRMAVELNGKAHYDPIYGEEALAAQKARDRRKKKRCNEIGVLLRSIKIKNPSSGDLHNKMKRVIWEIKKQKELRVNDENKSVSIDKTIKYVDS